MNDIIKDFLRDIDALAHNTYGDSSVEDFVEAADKAIAIINIYKAKAQDQIVDNVERLIDSFGGKDCTMRQLKGECNEV